jgi:hypothetical protein
MLFHKKAIITAALFCIGQLSFCQKYISKSTDASGRFSLGTRNTASLFSDDSGPGLGIGGQFRLQITERLNTEWFADYITSKNGSYTVRNDYHIGWSVLFYPGKTRDFSKLLQPYIIAGHCFDYSVVMEQGNPQNQADRTSMATQTGFGTHININSKLDCSISAQYMLHFGKEIHTEIETDAIHIEKLDHSSPHGHLLITMSFNYKFADLW